MGSIYNYLPENILNALGWTVLHSLWQAFLVALLFAAYLLVWQKTDARRRYWVGCAALGSTLLFSIITFFVLLENGGAENTLPAAIFSEDGELLGHYFIEESPTVFMDYFNENMPLIVSIWLMGMVLFLLKTMGGLLYIQRLKTRHLSPVPQRWQAILDNLQASLGISQKINIAASALVKVPMVVGWLKPLILMPVAAINQLTIEQVEAILAHELAHIARYDYFVNILQSVVEAMFYFNPAVWWISARIRTERENCCDDLAVATCGNSIAYAKALVSLQEMHQGGPAFAMCFSKSLPRRQAGKNQLLSRIQRILQSPDKKSNAMEKISATVLLLAAVLLLSVQAKSSFNNSADIGESSDFINEMIPDQMDTDTIPDQLQFNGTGIIRVIKTDGDIIEMELVDGEIKGVKVNGEQVPEEEYDEYSLENLSSAEIANIDVSNENGENHFPKGSFHYNRTEDGNDMEVRVKDGKIQYLKIDGEEIDEADYPDYEDMVEELVNEMPAPPPPPPAPAAPRAPMAPRVPGTLATPPAPPAPPIPPAPRSRTITTEKNGKGMTIIIENDNGEEPIEIEIDNHRKGNVIINGNEIKGLKDGDRMVYKQKIEGPDQSYFYDQGNNRVFWLPDDEAIADVPFPKIFFSPDGFEFPEMPALDDENRLLFKQLSEEQKARQHELFDRLKERQLLHKDMSEEQQELLKQRLEDFEKLHHDRSQQMEELKKNLHENHKQMQELEKKKNKEHRFLKDEQGALEKEIRLMQIYEKMETEKEALAELKKSGKLTEIDNKKYHLQMLRAKEEVAKLENNARLLQLERANIILLDEYRGAQ